MKEKLRKVFSNTFYQLLVIYTALILIISLSLFSKFTYHFEVFAIILGVLSFLSITNSPDEKLSKRWKYFLIILSFILIIGMRIIPYIGNSVPIGYDAGLYKYGIEHGLENNDSWILNGGMEPGFLYLMKTLSFLSSSKFLLIYGFIIFILLLGISIYFASKEFFGEKSAVLSLLIYSLSPIQFLVFSYMYYKNIIGLTLLLFAFIFLSRYEKTNGKKNIFLLIISAVLLASIHRPTFYIFGLSYLFYSFISPYKKKYDFSKLKLNIIVGISIIFLSSLFYLGKFSPAITSIISPVVNSLVEPGHAPGTFIDFIEYQFLILAYLPLAIIGFLTSIKNRKYLILSIWLIINSIIIYFQLFFFNRFIIHLDIIAIIFAGFGFSILMKDKKKLGIILFCALIISLGIITSNIAQKTTPIIPQDSIDLISSLSQTENNSYVLSISSEYSPFILAYSERQTIAPGMFQEYWNQDEWGEFWASPTKERTIELMNSLPRPIYLFAGTKEYLNECFSLYSEKANNKVFKYIC